MLHIQRQPVLHIITCIAASGNEELKGRYVVETIDRMCKLMVPVEVSHGPSELGMSQKV